jgi:hypothetical protein
MQELTKAVLKAMQEIDNVEKLLDVGTGNSSYKGVSDKDVKQQVRKIMIANGLVILPTSVEPKTTVSEWDEDGQYGKKHRVQVLTEVTTKYLLAHTSGESIEVCGYGHGVDSQDKSAGKATTYALKNLLLYSFLIPTGEIDDTDTDHSDNLPQRPAAATVTKPATGLQSKCTKCGTACVERSGISKTTNNPYTMLICPKANTENKDQHDRPIFL